jgi:hypothetical protein
MSDCKLTQVRLNVIATESVCSMLANSGGDPISESVLRAEVESTVMTMGAEQENVDTAINFALLFT